MAMQFEQSSFQPRKERSGSEGAYTDKLQALVRGAVYEGMSGKQVRRHMELMQQNVGIREQDQKEGGFLRAVELAEGMDAHERANKLFLEKWYGQLEKIPGVEKLSREEVMKRFDAFADREALLQAEQDAIVHYEKILADESEWSLPLREYLALHRSDIEALVNDLQVRDAERILDAETRRERLAELDAALAEIVDNASDNIGKRLELEEIYLLRRLAHDADNGHLVSVEHSTPRQDLRANTAIDFMVAAAGRAVPFQVKTFKGGTHADWYRQEEVHERAVRRLGGSGTRVVTLEAQAVDAAYDRVRGERVTSLKLTDAYTTLSPLVESLPAIQRERLLSLTGMTEENFAAEHERFEVKQRETREAQGVYFLREAERMKTFQEREREIRGAERREIEEARAREEALLAHEESVRQQREAAEREKIARLREREEAKTAKRAAAEQRAREAPARAEEARRLAAMHAEEEAALAAKRDEIRRKRTATIEAKEALGWPPKQFVGMLTPSLLQRLEFLPVDWKNDARQLLEAKKQFLQRFAKPKKGMAPAESDGPNELFKETFSTQSAFESPSQSRAA
jgi:hypothetical protein